jgi:hypothetical protein
MEYLEKTRQEFYKLIQRQNFQWELIDNMLLEEDEPAKPLKIREKKIKAKIELV